MSNLKKIKSNNYIEKSMPIDEFKKFYKTLNAKNIALLNDIYHENITFIDPFHKIQGLLELQKYFRGLYENVTSIDFIFGDTISQGKNHVVNWCMKIQHPKLNKNKLVKVYGCSHIKFEDIDSNSADFSNKEINKQKVIYHCDYFDAGSMLYEQLPIIGRIIKWIKGKF